VTDTILDYLEAKFGGGGPGADRFADDDDDEVHTSQIAACQRQHYLDRVEGSSDEASPYFELGRVFEMMYGAALAWERGDLDRTDLTSNKPWEVAKLVDAIEQDVNIEVDFGGARIPGEADWVVYKDNALSMVREKGGVDTVAVNPDGERAIRWQNGDVDKLSSDSSASPIKKVIETKTIKDLDYVSDGPKTKHFWQCYGYMYAMGAPGKVTYMVRDDWSMLDHHMERDDMTDMDLEARVRRKAKNLQSDEVPTTTDPPSKWSCYYCDHRASCDGSLW